MRRRIGAMGGSGWCYRSVRRPASARLILGHYGVDVRRKPRAPARSESHEDPGEG